MAGLVVGAHVVEVQLALVGVGHVSTEGPAIFGIDATATGPDNRRMFSFAAASVIVRRLPLFMRWRVVASVAGGKLKQSM